MWILNRYHHRELVHCYNGLDYLAISKVMSKDSVVDYKYKYLNSRESIYYSLTKFKIYNFYER